jgi:hypothetical protein
VLWLAGFSVWIKDALIEVVVQVQVHLRYMTAAGNADFNS